MSARKIRVLVVDDSAVIRRMICDAIAETSDLEVAGVAFDGRKAIDQFDAVAPDVVTLDIQMPNMDGLSTLDELLQRRPVPVIMVSSLTKLGADITLEALDRGAMDYVAKPERGADADAILHDELTRKIRSVAGMDVKRIIQIRRSRREKRDDHARQQPAEKRFDEAGATELADKCIALGISTGGPPALSSLFETIRPPMPPIVIVQHMPVHFTGPLAWRLNSISQLSIKEACTGDILRPNHVYIAPGGSHMELRRQGRWGRIAITTGPQVSGHKPSIDVMMKSAAPVYGSRLLGIIMTGMGHDGADGCGVIRQAGGFVLGQDEESSDVYGMNKVAFVNGNVDQQFSLADGPYVLMNYVRRTWLTPAMAST
jgi:two-component system chemotaxis response regulator CheB